MQSGCLINARDTIKIPGKQFWSRGYFVSTIGVKKLIIKPLPMPVYSLLENDLGMYFSLIYVPQDDESFCKVLR